MGANAPNAALAVRGREVKFSVPHLGRIYEIRLILAHMRPYAPTLRHP